MRLAMITWLLSGCCIPSAVSDKAVELATEKGIEAATGHEVDLQAGGDRIVVKGPDGEVTIDAKAGLMTGHGDDGAFRLQLGDATTYPSGLPIGPYPGAQVLAATDMALPTGRAAQVTLSTPDAIDQVAAFYEGALKSHGTLISNDMSSGGKVVKQRAVETATGTITVLITAESGLTTAHLVVGPKK